MIEENELENSVISIKMCFNGNYMIRFIKDDWIVERLEVSRETAIRNVKCWLNDFPNLKLHKHSLLRDVILDN